MSEGVGPSSGAGEVTERPGNARAGAASETSIVSRTYYRNLIIFGLILVVVCVGLVIFNSRNSGENSTSADGGDDSSVPVQDPDQTCIEELSEWLPWVTGPGSLLDAGAEWGLGSEEYQIVSEAWKVFRSNLYRVGNDEASAMAYDTIAQGCRNMTNDYLPGHPPPG